MYLRPCPFCGSKGSNISIFTEERTDRPQCKFISRVLCLNCFAEVCTHYLILLNVCGVIDQNAYNYVFNFYADLLMKAYEQGRKDAQQETCEDAVSRKKVIDAVVKESQVDGAYGYMDTKSIVDLLNDQPSVQTELCEDAISIDWITEYMNNMIGGSDRWCGVKWMLEDWTKWKESKKR